MKCGCVRRNFADWHKKYYYLPFFCSTESKHGFYLYLNYSIRQYWLPFCQYLPFNGQTIFISGVDRLKFNQLIMLYSLNLFWIILVRVWALYILSNVFVVDEPVLVASNLFFKIHSARISFVQCILTNCFPFTSLFLPKKTQQFLHLDRFEF